MDGRLCLACGKGHVLDTCERFMEKSLKQRTKHLPKEKCYYACHEPIN